MNEKTKGTYHFNFRQPRAVSLNFGKRWSGVNSPNLIITFLRLKFQIPQLLKIVFSYSKYYRKNSFTLCGIYDYETVDAIHDLLLHNVLFIVEPP